MSVLAVSTSNNNLRKPSTSILLFSTSRSDTSSLTSSKPWLGMGFSSEKEMAYSFVRNKAFVTSFTSLEGTLVIICSFPSAVAQRMAACSRTTPNSKSSSAFCAIFFISIFPTLRQRKSSFFNEGSTDKILANRVGGYN